MKHLRDLERRLEALEQRPKAENLREVIEEVGKYMRELEEENDEELAIRHDVILAIVNANREAKARGERGDRFPFPWGTCEALRRQLRENAELIAEYGQAGIVNAVVNLGKVEERLRAELAEREKIDNIYGVNGGERYEQIIKVRERS